VNALCEGLYVPKVVVTYEYASLKVVAEGHQCLSVVVSSCQCTLSLCAVVV
jgi:hypothetical protein